VKIHQGDHQADQPAQVARVVDVGDPDEAPQIRNSTLRSERLPSGEVSTRIKRQPQAKAHERRGESTYQNDREAPEAAGTRFGRGGPRDRDPREEPGGNETHPPRREEANLRDKAAGRQADVGVMELEELQPGELLR